MHVHVHVRAHAYVRVHAHAYAHVHVWMPADACSCMHACVHVYAALEGLTRRPFWYHALESNDGQLPPLEGEPLDGLAQAHRVRQLLHATRVRRHGVVGWVDERGACEVDVGDGLVGLQRLRYRGANLLVDTGAG